MRVFSLLLILTQTVQAAPLSNFHSRLKQIEQGRLVSANVVWLGDSIGAMGFISEPLRTMLQQRFDNAGVGFVSSRGVAPYATGAFPLSGTWTERTWRDGARGIAAFDYTAETAGAQITWWGTNSWSTEMILYYLEKPGGGTLRYKVDGGGWSAVLSTDGPVERLAVVVLPGLRYSQHELTVEVTDSGPQGVTLLGAEYRDWRPGARLHIAAHSGSQVHDFLTIPETLFRQQLAALEPSLVILEWGQNEAGFGDTPEEMRAHLVELIGRVKMAAPASDILLIGPYDKGFPQPEGRTLDLYCRMMRELAESERIAFFDFYPVFGPWSNDERWSLFFSDSAHVNKKGGRILARRLFEFLTSDVPDTGLRWKWHYF